MKRNETERNQERREATRRRILDAALRLFAREGYEATSIRRIAEEAGIALGLLYHYFESKERLLQAIFAQSMAEVRESFASGEGEGTPPERLERVIRRSFEIVRQNRDFWRLTYAVRFQTAVLAGLQSVMGDWIAEIQRTLEGHFADIGFARPAVRATLLFAAIDGAAQRYVLQPDEYPLDAVADAMVALFCYGKG